MKIFSEPFRKAELFGRRSGFTLVELIVVSMIIGILAGMMMIMTGPSSGGAQAAALLYDLRLVKAATMQYYFDNEIMPSEGLTPGGHTALAAKIEKYLDKQFSISYGGVIYYMEYGGKIYYGLSPDVFTESARNKLATQKIVYKSDGGSYDGGPGPYYMPVK
ncbi:MAG: type II secretion system GspH family protein [Synergistaceae bacterium]|jgi:prepilin-type N-terminal cleavage/methylation domain-containing protein|nr:type II secretion system GspH family protein [Synergistaceae bacterium]